MIPTPTSGDYSLYVHIPFCTKKCDYCHFFVLPDKEIYKDQLLRSLRIEADLRNSSLPSESKLVSLYFGGGTPALFGPERIKEVISWFSSCEEITLEANPDGVTLELMKAYKEAGINRVSLGIQSFDDPLLIKIGRTHNGSHAEKAVSIIKDAGIDNISIDLMYDLPTQSIDQWRATLERAAKLPITHLSLYNLTIEPQTVFFKYRESLEKEVPSEEASLEMYKLAQELLEKAGLLQYEISAFAKPGYHSKHNTGYWLGRPFYGLGPSAFSFWNGSRFRNVANLNKYSEALDKGVYPVDFEETLDSDASERELFAVQLRLMQGAPLPSFKNELEPLIKEGLLEIEDSRVKMTKRGILVYDSIATEII